MSRPAPPESETPLIERLRKAQWDETAHRGEFNKAIQAGAPIPILEMVEGVARLCGEAATALSLAQTEIKGHMRVEDEFKARIAELEKDGARLDWFDSHRFSAYSSTSHCVVVDEQKQPRRGRVGKTLRAAIDAALKSRA